MMADCSGASCGVKPEKGQGWIAYSMSFISPVFYLIVTASSKSDGYKLFFAHPIFLLTIFLYFGACLLTIFARMNLLNSLNMDAAKNDYYRYVPC